MLGRHSSGFFLGSHHSSSPRSACWRVVWHLFSTVTSFHHFDFLTGYWWTFPFLHLSMSYTIMFIMVLKQLSRGTLALLDSWGLPRLFSSKGLTSDLICCFLGTLGRDLRGVMPCHQIAQHKSMNSGNIYIYIYGIHVLQECISPYRFTSAWIINLDQVFSKLFIE